MTETIDHAETFDSGAFIVYSTKYGTFNSKDKDGNGLSCGADRDAVIFWSREHLTGFPNSTCFTTTVTMTSDALK